MKVCADEETAPGWQALGEMLRPELLKRFKPAFLGRLKVVPYYPITDKIMRLIIKLKLNRIGKRMKENRNIAFVYDEALIDHIAKRCTEVDSGARNADHILTNTLLPEMSREILSRMATGEQFKEVKVFLSGEEFGFEVV
ncbi:MAG: type VI secretion system ATPase TssH, partial [Deltaproteobacteria bacterium]